MPSRSIRIGADSALHLLEWAGRGRAPLLLLHGMAGNAHWWDATAPLLADEFDVKALDFHGHGDSAWRPDGDYAIAGFVEDIEQARSALGWERFILCGHSMGALLTLEYARKYPRRLVSAASVDFMPEYRESRRRSFLRRGGARQPVYPDREAMIARFHLQPPENLLDAGAMRILAGHCLKAVEGGYSWKTDWRVFALRYDAVWSILPEIRVPFLIVRGERSIIMERPAFERVAAAVPGARAVELPRAFHHVPLDVPAELASAIAGFCAAVREGGRR